ncbi:SBBP repeat-containing protein [bacterium]|nr:SBBP repeat-containing protein [bacterium]
MEDGFEAAFGLAVNKIGEAIVTGTTNSFDFPTNNPIRSYSGDLDAFVTKFYPSGSAIVYSTYLGGLNEDISNGVAVDRFGNAYVTGSTRSSTFPRKRKLFPFHPGFKDAFITKINRIGNMVYSVFFGGSDLDVANAIAVTKAGNVYISGYSESKDLPTKNALQPLFGRGETKAFLTKVNSQGTGLIFSTYFGGDGLNVIRSLQLDSSATAHIVGAASTTNMVLVDPVQNGNRGGSDAIIAKISASGAKLIFASYLGGGNGELGNAGAIDSMGCFYVAGNTSSPSTFPLENPFQDRYGGGTEDGFIIRIGNNP